MMRRLPLFCVLALTAGAARAGDKPIYGPAPDWIVPAPPIDPAKLTGSGPALLIFDSQTRMEKGVVVTYLDTATRAISAQSLGEMGNVAIPWMPDRGDLSVHRAEILRGSERIDLLAGEERFSVLRREEMMEQRMLTGMLTATMSVAGLRVGDVLRVTFSISQADPALQGRVIGAAPSLAEPLRVGFGRARFLWPTAEKVRWKGYAEGLKATETTIGGMHDLTVSLPLAKQPDLPEDLPLRLRRPMLIEASSFADWEEVSRTLAPLFDPQNMIAPGSPIAAEVAKIAAADKDPMVRTQRALSLVQDQIRYLAIAMNGGGLTPQAPARTWEVRYGDCKAKTLLLLAMLRELGIEAEAVLVSATTGGLAEARLPGTAAFDHVIVRATVNGETLWLDGTRLGDRIEDIRDVPPFQIGLPLRRAGAGLMRLPGRPSARPIRVVDIKYDHSAGLDMPSRFDATFTVRGQYAQLIEGVASQATDEQRREFVQGLVMSELGEPQLATTDIRYDAASATATITASGLTTTPWRRENGRYRWGIDRAVSRINFAPDRTRAAWRTLPVATEATDSVVHRSTIILPKGAEGFTLSGDQTLPETLTGRRTSRKVDFKANVLTVEDRVDSFGAELPADSLPAERARYAQARTRSLELVAPSQLPSRYERVMAARRDGAFKPIEAAFAAAIAADPDEASGYKSRAVFRAGVYDHAGAIADFTRVIELGDEVDARLRRGDEQEAAGNLAKAIADYEAALALDPANDEALLLLAGAKDRAGDAKAALALLDGRIARGDKASDAAVSGKAEILSLNGDAVQAVAMLDGRIEQKPSDPDLLNSRCWNKAIGKVALDTALKDCTKAIELSDNPAAALDSRALVFARLERWDEALADLNAALDASPRAAASLYLRGVVRTRMGQATAAKDDLASARLYHPPVDAMYRRLGMTP